MRDLAARTAIFELAKKGHAVRVTSRTLEVSRKTVRPREHRDPEVVPPSRAQVGPFWRASKLVTGLREEAVLRRALTVAGAKCATAYGHAGRSCVPPKSNEKVSQPVRVRLGE